MKKKIVLFVAGLALATAVIGSASSTSHAMMPREPREIHKIEGGDNHKPGGHNPLLDALAEWSTTIGRQQY